VGFSLGRKMPIELLLIPLGMASLLLAFIKNRRIRLDEVGITQGFSVFRTFMRYEGISTVRKEVRSFKGASTVLLVLYEKNSARRIVIPIASFDRIELGQVLAALAQAVPHANFEVETQL
jgi:hypothetical protein